MEGRRAEGDTLREQHGGIVVPRSCDKIISELHEKNNYPFPFSSCVFIHCDRDIPITLMCLTFTVFSERAAN